MGIKINEINKESEEITEKDLKVMLIAEKFLRENGFSLMKEFEDTVSKIACINNR
ncbi:hypothetical protein [Tepidibacter hydrothermalis]|uniref:Uncharacterized protein n=1 Tax=Tepidibacter hydrothermalis TaxID=3036126 RepID=A0ABY8EAX8_9FIRM|nr:hypothetical protein [Tepidibacter hydrothermalis]WFD08667.1 hypothetical protein P4S50_09660 [Tepidibacter hydrothermalis]